MNLQPQRGDEKVAIPITFETRSGVLAFKKSRLIISLIIMVLGIIFWIVTLIIGDSAKIKWIITGIVFGILPLICRFAIIHEHSFRKQYNTLADADYTYDYKLFWNIYDTSEIDGVTFFHHTSGAVSVFVAFDKGVIVGKGDYSDYDHYEAISQAYNLLHKRGIRCTHIDYMDSVGKDVRLQNMYDNVKGCENPELQASVLDMIDYMQYQMMGTYADYDVYCFTAKMRPDLMWDELSSVLGAFLGGNYIRDRVLDRRGVRDVVSTVFRLPDFSVTRTCDSLFGNKASSRFLRIIWTETDGKREIVNKTKKQMAEEARLAQMEKEAQRAMRGRGRKGDDRIIDILDDAPASAPQSVNLQKGNPFGQPQKNAGFGQPQAQQPVTLQKGGQAQNAAGFNRPPQRSAGFGQPQAQQPVTLQKGGQQAVRQAGNQPQQAVAQQMPPQQQTMQNKTTTGNAAMSDDEEIDLF